MTAPRVRRLRPPHACLLSLLLVGLTTWGLARLQSFVTALEGGHVHPYTLGFLLPIALVTLLGGRLPGLLTLLLSVLSSAYALMVPRFSPHIRYPSDWAELALLAVTGTVVTLGMDAVRRNLDLLQETQRTQARLRAVMDTSPVGIVTCDLDGTLRYANQAAERIWGHPLVPAPPARWAQYRILEPDGTPTPPGRTTLARVLAGEAERLTRELIIEQPGGTRLWVESSAALVRDAQGRSLGGLVVMQDITARKRAEQEVAGLLAQAQARAEREALLNRIGEAIRSSPEPTVIQAQAAQALGPALGVDRCYFALAETARGTIQIGPDWRRPGLPSLTGEYRLSDFGASWEALFPDGRTLVAVGDGSSGLSAAAVEAFARVGLRATLSVPFLEAGRVIGVLTVAMADRARAWTADEVALVETVAAQTRAALESARVRLRERAIATTLQDALRPRPPERVPGLDLAAFYRAALEESNVGGDFYDVFPLDKGLFALAVGDVSGKGLAAAAQVATVRNMLRYALYRQGGVTAAVTELNRVLSAQGLLAGFVTLFVGVYDTAACRLDYVSCGHEPGLVRHRGGGVTELPPTGPVLGAADDAAFAERSLLLTPGDALLLYTDGISEAGRSRRDLWGTEGLTAWLASGPGGLTADALCAHVVAGAVAHAQGDLHDDVCLLATVVQPNGLPATEYLCVAPDEVK